MVYFHNGAVISQNYYTLVVVIKYFTNPTLEGITDCKIAGNTNLANPNFQ